MHRVETEHLEVWEDLPVTINCLHSQFTLHVFTFDMTGNYKIISHENLISNVKTERVRLMSTSSIPT